MTAPKTEATVCVTGKKVFLHPGKDKKHHDQFGATKYRPGMGNRAASGFDFPTTLVGATSDGRAAVYYDPSLGAEGQQNAADVLASAGKLIAFMDAVFGYVGGKHNIIVANLGATDGTGGAYHYGCDFSSGADLYLCAAFGNSPLVDGLYVAELSEAYMGPNSALGQKQNNPWGCGYSNGEGLSRVCANYACVIVGAPGAMEDAGFGAASSWNTADDWISQTEQTDGDYDSTGAAMCYINWMLSQSVPFYKLVQAPCDNCEQNYNALTGKSGAYKALVSAVNGLSGGVQSDEPFVALDPATAVPGGGSPPPNVLSISVSPTSGTAALTVSYSVSGNTGTPTVDFGDGWNTTGTSGSHIYTSAGSYSITATDGANKASASVSVSGSGGSGGGSPPPSPQTSGYKIQFNGTDTGFTVVPTGQTSGTAAPAGKSPDAIAFASVFADVMKDKRVKDKITASLMHSGVDAAGGILGQILAVALPIIISDLLAGKTIAQTAQDVIAALLAAFG